MRLSGKRKQECSVGLCRLERPLQLEDTLFAGAVISRIKEHFTIHCDSSLTAEMQYNAVKDDLHAFAPNLTHYHRLVDRFGLIEDIRFCMTPDVANVLPLYKEGMLIAK